jgi:hypothetical protein
MAVTENAASIPDAEMIAKGRCMEKRAEEKRRSAAGKDL